MLQNEPGLLTRHDHITLLIIELAQETSHVVYAIGDVPMRSRIMTITIEIIWYHRITHVVIVGTETALRPKNVYLCRRIGLCDETV